MSTVVTTIGEQGLGTYTFDQAKPALALKPSEGRPEGLLVPGFIDIHCHGAFGIDFMSASSSEVSGLADRLVAEGYEGFLPTTVTAPAASVKAALRGLPRHPAILGFHLEGPFISPKFPGAQPPSAIALPPAAPGEWDEIFVDERLKVITVAPELPGCLDLIRRLSARGVKVGMGHTNATYAEAQLGFEAGATHCTHTFNAMRPLHHREAGMVGFALNEPKVATELIYDRLHVERHAASILLRNKPGDKVIAVSDSTMATGLSAATKLTMWGLHCEVGVQQVRLADGTLAGSAITLRDAFANLADDFGLEVAIRATSLNPRRLLGLGTVPRTYLLLNRAYEIIGRYELRGDVYEAIL